MKHRLISLLFLLTFLPAAIDKLMAEKTPDWFLKQFEPTLLGIIPSLMPLQFYGLGVFEAVVAIFFIAALIQRKPGLVFEAALVTAFLAFLALGLGQRLSHKFDSAADLFFYATLTFLIYQSFYFKKKENV